jgi:AmiR/NasT family two-component response regulator
LGALNLYAAKFNGSDRDRAAADALAAHAALVLSNAVAWDNVHGTNIRLTQALASRAVIGQAQGILMVREHIGPNEAFAMLRRASQRTNRKVREIAAELAAQATAGRPTEADRDANK